MLINKYRALIVIKPGLIYKKSEFTKEQFKVAIENENYIILDDYSFTRVCKEKCDYDTTIETQILGHSINDSCWGTSIRYTLYTTKNKTTKSIKTALQKYIDEELNVFGGVDLSFIK